MKRHKRVRAVVNGREALSIRPEYFVFCEKLTGAARFRVPAQADGRLPVEQAASLLAVHCLARQQAPEDYAVMFSARVDLLRSVSSRARHLLQSARVFDSSVRLSRRETEVLRGILQHLSNKEIAAGLHLSERTVKFHVSSLLAKFAVRDRLGLIREAGHGLMPAPIPSGPADSALQAGLPPIAPPPATPEAPAPQRSVLRSLARPAAERILSFPRGRAMA